MTRKLGTIQTKAEAEREALADLMLADAEVELHYNRAGEWLAGPAREHAAVAALCSLVVAAETWAHRGECDRWECLRSAREGFGGFCSQACDDLDSEARAEQIAAWSVSEYAYPERPEYASWMSGAKASA